MQYHSETTTPGYPMPPAPWKALIVWCLPCTLMTDGKTQPLTTVQTHPSLPFQTALKELPTPSPTAIAHDHSPIPSLPPAKATTDPTNPSGTHPLHPDSPTSWLRDAFEPVFKALDRLATKIHGLHMAIIETLTSHNSPSLLTKMPPMPPPESGPQQTHHHHQNHMKHIHFLRPPLPIPHPN